MNLYDEMNPPPLSEKDGERAGDEASKGLDHGTERATAAARGDVFPSDPSTIAGPAYPEDDSGEPALIPISLAAFLAMELPPREMLLHPWLPAKGLAMVFAKAGVGKTHLALAVAYAIASGGELLRWRAERPRRILYIDGEMPAQAMQERLAGIVANNDREPPDDTYFRVLLSDMGETGLPDLATTEGQLRYNAAVGDAELIVIDNLSTLCRSGIENEAESWRAIQEWLLLQRREGRSVLLVHHAGKGGDQRGTSKRGDVLDTVIRLDHPDGYEASEGARFVIAFPKVRGTFGEGAQGFEARFVDGRWTAHNLADALAEEVRGLSADGHSQRDIAAILKDKGVSVSASKVNRILNRGVPADGGQ